AVLKGTGKVGPNRRSPLLRSGLVIAQFTISIILFIGTFVVRDQLHFIQTKKLGFNKEQVVVVEKTDDLFGRIVPFMDELRQKPHIIQVSNSSNLLGQNFGSSVHRMAEAGGEETHLLWNLRTDYDFAATYEIEIAAGRYFSRDWSTDSTAVVINETAARALGISDPIGKTLINVGPRPDLSQSYTIIGVARDFHFESLYQQIRPLAIKLFNRNNRGRFVSVRIASEDIANTVSTIEATWHKFAGNQAFEYVFFDQEFGKLYEAEQRTAKILTIFSGLAIFIACLGLLGLASFTTEQRTKEIGIRKTLGASVSSVVVLLSREFTKWVLLANIVAWPVAYFAMSNWLQNFAYRVNIEAWIFLTAAAAALAIALLTVSYQTIRAALSNPVEALRYE
ncbi:MAG TPA: FtsX-like permease family protein, partial [bacterium]